MNLSECHYIGFVAKKFSFKGEIIINVNIQNIEPLLDIPLVYFDFDETIVPYKVSKARKHQKNHIRLQLFQVDNDKVASKLLGRKVYISKREHINPLSINNIDHFIGYKVVDGKSTIGIVRQTIQRSPQHILVVLNEEKEILIPMHKDLIVSIDTLNKVIKMSLPDGLITLNQ